MAMYKLYISLFIIACLVLPSQGLHEGSTRQGLHHDDDNILTSLNQTFSVLARLLAFFQQDIDRANLDAIYGLRVAEGILQTLLKNHRKFLNETTKIHDQLTNFHKQIVSLSNDAQVFIKKQDQFYYDRFQFIVDKPWGYDIEFGQRNLPDTSGKENGVVRNWNEDISDQCMSDVIGSNDIHTKCTLTKTCRGYLTDLYQTRYGTTHQILFLTLALIRNCEEKYSKAFKNVIGMDINEFIVNRCVKIMHEMVELENQGVTTDEHDLYIEQSLVCGMHGYEEFFSMKRLMAFLSWQLYPGCFGNVTSTRDQDMGTSGAPRETRGARSDIGMSSMRRLLVDVELDYGCSSHESGVAVGLLGMYVKWLVYKLDKPVPVIKTTPMTTAPTTTTPITTTTTPMTTTTKTAPTPTLKEKNGKVERSYFEEYPLFISILVSVLTTLITLTIVCILYTLFKYCVRTKRHDNPYKKLNRSNNNYVA